MRTASVTDRQDRLQPEPEDARRYRALGTADWAMSITLKSGKTIHANRGILCIAPDLAISEGYDGGIAYDTVEARDDPDYNGLTPDEVVELADIAIERRQQLKQRAIAERVTGRTD